MLQDLRKFLFKESLVDVAVAFILATAFAAVVKSLVNDVMMPLIAAIVGKPSFDEIVVMLGDTPIKVGTFLTALVNFLLIGTVLFFVVRTIVRVTQLRGGAKVDDEKVVADEVVILRQIRDALMARPGS
ncbi:large conductance mechanosensitive channel protein MscL [Patulibacter sp. SYSU D01012]|uniref:large conductance mechanosensitive channel protein MscL n=1 Tax=Patulibacter sp. SYSU D01012 TaxID=2817381 RepID=UPI001B307A84